MSGTPNPSGTPYPNPNDQTRAMLGALRRPQQPDIFPFSEDPAPEMPTEPPAGTNNLLVSLPRSQPSLDIYVDKGKTETGCVICNRAIPRGSYRFSLVVRLAVARQDTQGRMRHMERYNAHAGCLLESLEGRRTQTGYDCWDCGVSPGNHPHPVRCFTTSRFAYGYLCHACCQLRRWQRCNVCDVFFPPHMVSAVVGLIEDHAEYEDVVSDGSMDACEWCAERGGLKTKKVADAERKEFEALRAAMKGGQVFGHRGD